jgi:lipopolysaccharide export system protein LptA
MFEPEFIHTKRARVNVCIGSMLACLFFLLPSLKAQQKVDKIDLVNADVFEGGTLGGQSIYKFRGKVIFKQKGMFVYCDSAYQYARKNGSLEAFGHVRIVQGDSVTVTGNTLHYEPDTRNATVKGNVVFTDKGTTLKTDVLDYNMETKVASYASGGVIRDGKTVLVSTKGTYNSLNKFFYFRNKVKVTGKDGTLLTDTLDYNTTTKTAYFRGPSQIINIDGVVYADKGEYKTEEKLSILKGRAKVESGSYIITGDQMYNDESRKISIIKKNVKVVSLKDSITIEGDVVHYSGSKGVSKIFGNAIMKNYAEKDTLYLTADTLLSIDNNIASEKRLYAYNHARIFRNDLQGKCDSLVYNFADSTIYFNRDPVLWSEGSQLLADSINIQLANKKIDKLNMNVNSFIITLDSLKNYNQVKGKKMIAYFQNNAIHKVDVNGNGESIYFALEKDSILVGMNKVICSDIMIKFLANKVNSITFINEPDALFIPPHEILEPEKKLKGFRWRIMERPTLEEVLSRRLEKKKI